MGEDHGARSVLPREEPEPEPRGESEPTGPQPPSKLRKVAKVSRYPVLILLLISADDQVDRYLLSALFPAIKEQFRLSDLQLGLLSSAFVVVATLGAVPFGIFVDRFVRVRIAAAGESVRSVAMIFTGLAGSYPMLFGSRMFLGAAEASYTPAAFSLISDYYPVRERGRMIGLFQIGAILGFVALPVGAFIGETYGWRSAFHFFAIPGFILAMLAWRLPEPERGRADREHSGLEEAEAGTKSFFARMPSLPAFITVLKIPSVLIALVSNGLAAFFVSGLGIWAVTFLVRFHDMSLTQASLTTGLLAVGAITGALSGGYFGDRLVTNGKINGRIYVASAAKIVGVALLIPAFWVDNTPLMILLFGLGAVTLTMPNPPLSAIRADVVHPDLRGRASSATSLVSAFSAAASPLIFGALSDGIGLRAAFILVLPLMGIGGVLLLILGPRYLRTDMERMQRQLAGVETIVWKGKAITDETFAPPRQALPGVEQATLSEPAALPPWPGLEERPASQQPSEDAPAPANGGPRGKRRGAELGDLGHRRGPGAVLFYGMCTAGIALSLTLAVVGARQQDPFEVTPVAEVREGTVSSVEATVTNATEETRCPVVHIAARDRNARDLADVPAAPLGVPLEPGQSTTYAAVIDTLDAQTYREELEEFRAYVRDDQVCP